MTFQLIFIFNEASRSVIEATFFALEIVTHFEDCALVFEVVENLCVHLDLQRVGLLEYWIETVVEHACRLLAPRESILKLLVFVEEGGEHHKVHAVFQYLSQDSSAINLRVAFCFNSSIKSTLIDSSKVLDILDTFLQICHLFNVKGKKGIQRNFAVNVGFSVHEAACVRVRTPKTLLNELLLFLKLFGFSSSQVLR